MNTFTTPFNTSIISAMEQLQPGVEAVIDFDVEGALSNLASLLKPTKSRFFDQNDMINLMIGHKSSLSTVQWNQMMILMAASFSTEAIMTEKESEKDSE